MIARRTLVVALSVLLLASRFVVAADLGDVNHNDVVDAIDVQLVINAALGIEIDPSYTVDINGDELVNAIDVQLVINAALGITPGEPVAPDAAFSAAPGSGPAPLDVAFTDESVAGSSEIISWMWTFGDGEASTDQNPEHTYDEPGAYTVSLTVSTDDGTDTETRFDYILAKGISPGEGAPGTKVNIIGDDFSAADQMDISIYFGAVEMPPAAAADHFVTTSAPIMDVGVVDVRVEIEGTVVVEGLSFEVLALPQLTDPPGTVAAGAQNDLATIRAVAGTLTDLFGDTISAKQAETINDTLDVIDLQLAAIDGMLDNAPEEDRQKVDELFLSSGLADELAAINVEAGERMHKCAEMDMLEFELWLKSGSPAKAWTIPARYRFVADWLAARLHHGMEYANVALLGLNAFAAAGGGGCMSAGLGIIDVFAGFINIVYTMIEMLPMQLETDFPPMIGRVGENNVISVNSFGNVVFLGTFKPECSVEQTLFGIFVPGFGKRLGLDDAITAPLTAYGSQLIALDDSGGISLRPVPPEQGVPIYTYDFVGDPPTAPNIPLFTGGGIATLSVDESRIYTGEQDGGPLRLYAKQKVYEFKGSFWNPIERPHVEEKLAEAEVFVYVREGADIELDEPAGEGKGEGESFESISGTVTNPDGSPAADTTVTITVTTTGAGGLRGTDVVTTTTDGAGRFQADVPLFPGENIIEVAVTVDEVTTTVDVEVTSGALPAAYCVVTNVVNDSLALVDPVLASDFKLIESADLDEPMDAPRGAVFLPDGETLVVLNSPRDAPAYLLAIRLHSLDDIGSISPPLMLGDSVPESIAVAPDGKTVIVPCLDGESAVYVVDVRQPTDLRIADVVDFTPYDAYGAKSVATGISADGRHIALVTTGYWQDGGPSDVVLLDVTNPYSVAPLSSVEVSSRSGLIATVPGESLAVVGGISVYYGGTTADAAVDVIDFSDPEHPEVADTLNIPSTFGMGFAVVPAGDVALLADAANSQMIFVDISDPHDIAEMSGISPLSFLGSGGLRIAVSPDGRYAVLTNNMSDTAALFDLSDMEPPTATQVQPTKPWDFPVGVTFRPHSP